MRDRNLCNEDSEFDEKWNRPDVHDAAQGVQPVSETNCG